jgi:RNA polymerase sigma-70 factor (ECF subfamily)
MKTLSDDQLYIAFIKGNNASFDELMVRYGDSLTYYLWGKLGDMQEAEDLMIEAFARILVRKPRIREGNFKAYLFKVGKNLVSRFYSRSRSRDHFSLEEMYQELSDSYFHEDRMLDDERDHILHLCLERIDPMMREALWLVYFEDLSYAETAEVMNVSVKKIDNLLPRRKKRLKEELEKDGVDHAY